MIINMIPILARYGSIFIYSYTAMLATGILLGIGLTAWLRGHDRSINWFDAMLVILVGAIIGGRLGFVFLHWGYFQERITESWQFSQGGFNYHTALLVGLLALWLWAILKRESCYQIGAILAPAILLVMVFGWGACWLEGCAYGRESELSLWSTDLPDDLGVFAVRLQSQLIGMLLAVLFFFLVLWLYRKINPGYLFWFALGALSLIHLLVGFLRGDPTIIIGNLRLDLIIDGILIGISIILLQYESMRTRSIRNKSPG